ncbi:MAG: hypothetical protein WCO06_04885 [Candidatus Roizmanbacteria bacterium]
MTEVREAPPQQANTIITPQEQQFLIENIIRYEGFKLSDSLFTLSKLPSINLSRARPFIHRGFNEHRLDFMREEESRIFDEIIRKHDIHAHTWFQEQCAKHPIVRQAQNVLYQLGASRPRHIDGPLSRSQIEAGVANATASRFGDASMAKIQSDGFGHDFRRTQFRARSELEAATTRKVDPNAGQLSQEQISNLLEGTKGYNVQMLQRLKNMYPTGDMNPRHCTTT